MNDEAIDRILKDALAGRPEHVSYGDLAQRAMKLARQQAIQQLLRVRRMSQAFGAIALVLVCGVLWIGYQRYSIIAANWAGTDAAATLSTNTISTTWVTYQSPAMVVVILIGAIIVGAAILRQFGGDDSVRMHSELG